MTEDPRKLDKFMRDPDGSVRPRIRLEPEFASRVERVAQGVNPVAWLRDAWDDAVIRAEREQGLG